MDQIKYQEFLDTIRPLPSTMDIIKGACDDMGIQLIQMDYARVKLCKLGRLDMQIMTISLTTCTGNSWLMGNSIEQVYNQIIKNFK